MFARHKFTVYEGGIMCCDNCQQVRHPSGMYRRPAKPVGAYKVHPNIATCPTIGKNASAIISCCDVWDIEPPPEVVAEVEAIKLLATEWKFANGHGLHWESESVRLPHILPFLSKKYGRDGYEDESYLLNGEDFREP